MAVVKLLIILMFVFIVPLFIGMSVTDFMDEKYRNSAVTAIAAGTMVMFALFQLVAVPVIIFARRFSLVLWIWGVITGVYALASFVANIRRFRDISAYTKKQLVAAGVIGIAALVIVVFQSGYLAFNLHYDDDDARYVPSIVSAVEKDTMFVDNPITGETMYWDVSETAKDMVSPWTIYWAVLSKLCMIHPAIVCHTVVPMLYIIIAYFMYILIGKELFSDDMKKISVFVILVSLLNIFSGYSVYNAGAFLLLRIWQGKALFAGMVLPFLFWLAIKLFKNDLSRKECIIALIACMAASMTTGFGIFLAPLFLFLCMIIHGIKNDRWDLYVRIAACMVPNIIYAVLYVYGQNLFIF